jgi:acyl carrier protein
MSIETELKNYIAKDILRLESGDELDASESLSASGKVDSLSMLQILGYIQQRYSIDLLTSGNPKDYESIESLCRAIGRLGGENLEK